jgi:branched-chain amino acid transport system permease protein
MSATTTILDQLFNGLTIGIVYVLIAAGLSIIFGLMDVINFAHGELFALGGYVAFAAAAPFGGTTGFWAGIIIAPIVVGAVGMAIERFTIRPLYDRSPLYQILLTFGLVLIINDGIQFIWGKQAKQFSTPALLDGTFDVLGYSYSLYNLVMIVFGLLLALGIYLALEKTRFGLIVRGGAEDREMVRNLGIDIDNYYTLVFGFGAALAGLAGVILGAFQSVNPSMGMSVINPAFVIVVLGGLGSFPGAVVGGLAVGVIQSMTQVYIPELSGLVLYMIMIVVLLVKPQGLFGSAVVHSPGGDLLTQTQSLVTRATRRRIAVLLVLALALVPIVAGLTGQSYLNTLFINILIWALFALSIDFVIGYTGLVSLCHAVFYGVGTYTSMIVILEVTQSVIVAGVLAMVAAAVVAWLIGFVSIRVSGVYFAIITLAIGVFFYNLIPKFRELGASDGLFGAQPFFGIAGVGVRLNEVTVGLGPIELTGQGLYYYFLLAVVIVSYLASRRLINSSFGAVLKSIRENEQRTRFIGYNVTAHKRRAYMLSGGLAGLSGALYVFNYGFVAPADFFWLRSAEVVVMTVLGGMGTLYGPMIGAGVFVAFSDFLSGYLEQWRMIFGAIFVLFVIFVPQGLVSIPSLIASRFDLGTGPEEPPGIVAEETRGDD